MLWSLHSTDDNGSVHYLQVSSVPQNILPLPKVLPKLGLQTWANTAQAEGNAEPKPPQLF